MIVRININSFLLSFSRNLIYYLIVLFWMRESSMGKVFAGRHFDEKLTHQTVFCRDIFHPIFADPFILIGFYHVVKMFSTFLE